MRCMTKTTTHRDKDPNPRNKYNLMPETARVGVQKGKVTSGVLQTRSGYDSIWVVVDHLTKVAHFIPVKTTTK